MLAIVMSYSSVVKFHDTPQRHKSSRLGPHAVSLSNGLQRSDVDDGILRYFLY
ncbi:hypothetical protein DPMN_027884 [Dreissena polymorpha]|uniref:Uncharacterized protein n=1 Tax=Dreissena polymorpha TaxID=45954 RepID=A0A9D4RE19_DREPO|nr:hypothetical protein DPMN_027884 [Dreissena polymorpha]